ALTSFGTTTVVTASAAVTDTSISTSYTNKEKENKSCANDEKTVTGLVNAAISVAQGDFVKAVKTSLGLIPYGKCLASLFEFGMGLITDILNEQDPSGAVEAPSIEEIKVQLDKVREQLNEIEGLVKELKNEDFNKSINTLIRMYDKHNAKITNLAKARYELAKAKKDGTDTTVIEKKQQIADKALKAITDIDSKDVQDLRKGIEKCTQYMAGKTQGGMKDNPFRINLDSVMTSAGSGSFGNYIYNETVEKYDKAIWTYYTTALTLYTSLERININELAKTDEDTAKERADELQLFLNGKLNGETKTERKINAADAYKYYKENVVNEEIKYKDQYKYKSEWKKYFTEVGTAKANSNGFMANNDYANREMVTYIDNYSNSGKLTVKNEEFAKNFEYLNDMIAEYKKACDSDDKLTLREFLEKNLCTKLPSVGEYLAVGQMKAECCQYGGDYSYSLDIPVIKLDEGNASVENIELIRRDTYRVYNEKSLDNVCYFAKEIKKHEKMAVVKEHSGKETVFESFSEAWSYVNERGGTIKLYADVTAKKVTGSNATAFGEGKYFTYESNKGALYVRRYITVDLNGHTINRNQTTPVNDGSVFVVLDGNELIITDSSGTNNGTITGGNTTGNGGGISSINKARRIIVENCKIKNNRANGYGGGVHLECISATNSFDAGTFYNVEITNNYAGKSGNDISTEAYGFKSSDVTIGGRVVIGDCYLEDASLIKNIIHIEKQLTSDSKIGITSNNPVNWKKITAYNDRDYSGNFYYSGQGHKIVNYGQYLYIYQS
ncbi:MAG: hypothetical protein ACI4RI_03390, partial [Ruminococcus sp.]